MYFGANQAYPNRSATYAPAPSTENIMCQYDARFTYGSWDRQEGVLDLLDPVTHGLHVLQQGIVHEIQHSLDHMEDQPSESSGDRYGAALSALTHYRDEFRAYWISGQYDEFSDAPGSGLHGWGSRRQEEITHQLTGESEQDLQQGYEDIGFHYHRNNPLPGTQPRRTFQAAVRAYGRPEGVNLINLNTDRSILRSARSRDAERR
jgi:hypothetical protein